MPARHVVDAVLKAADEALRTLFAPAHAQRAPVLPADSGTLSQREKRHAAGLMRVNHAGEIAAQGLYRGQAAVARSRSTRELLQHAAAEEAEHLAWCEARLAELDARPSRLNPLWYFGSFGLGTLAAALGDAVSLGFVTETETQVEGHLASHLERLPLADQRSRSSCGSRRTAWPAPQSLPAPIPTLMRYAARVMTGTAYWL